jgi:thioester reductase-like protein
MGNCKAAKECEPPYPTLATAAAKKQSMSNANALNLAELLSHGARHYPQAVLAADARTRFSYAAAWAAAGSAAALLRQHGVQAQARVGLLSQRCAETVVAMHAIWSVGACVVLLDAEWPDAAIRERCEAAGVQLLVHLDPFSALRPIGIPALRWSTPTSLGEAPADPVGGGDDPAYIIFTSGSTRRAKAVAVSHQNVLTYATALSGRLDLADRPAPTFAHATTFAADLGHTSIFVPLVLGGTCAVLGAATARDPGAFWKEAAALGVSWLKTTPSHFRALMEAPAEERFRMDGVILGGERLRHDLAAHVLDSGVCGILVNHYGPTETTIGVACFIMKSVRCIPDGCESVPIGSAIGANELVLDSSRTGDPQRGELVIHGPSVALGYLEAPETGRGFVADSNPSRPGRAYRTGDLCREVEPNSFEFLHRLDRVVKVRGYSVDLNEVERALLSLAGVGEALAVAHQVANNTRIVAAVTPAAGADVTLSPKLLTAALSQMLPDYVVPSLILALPEIPRTANGKRDAAALTALAESTCAAAEAPGDATALELRILDLVGNLLGRSLCDPNADFIRLGADSITLMRIAARMAAQGMQVSLDQLMAYPTAKGIAGLVDRQALGAARIPARPLSVSLTLSSAQRAFFDQLPATANLWNQAVLVECHRRLDVSTVFDAHCWLLRRHPLLRQRFSADGRALPQDKTLEIAGFGATRLSPVRDAAERAIVAIATRVQDGVSIERGHVFHLHLFRGEGDMPDQLLMVAHHLVVDVVSWQIILDDLQRYLSGTPVEVEGSDLGNFWQFTEEQALPGGLAEEVVPAAKLPWQARWNEEGPRSRILALDEQESRSLFGEQPSGRAIEARLFDALARSLRSLCGSMALSIDIEQHGRPADAMGAAYAGTVGWFTRLARATLVEGQDPTEGTLAGARRLVAGTPAGDVLFNYVGNLDNALQVGSGWRFSRLIFGPLRCAAADSAQTLKVTGRIVQGRLIVDFVVDGTRVTPAHHRELVEHFARHLGCRSGGFRHWLSPVSTSGHVFLAAAPPACFAAPAQEHPTVILTGATGFLGSHILNALLGNGARVVALVRGASSADARARLLAEYSWAFPEAPREHFEAVEVQNCDLAEAQPDAKALLRILGTAPKALIHAAADTRLFAPEDELERTNVAGTMNVVHLCSELSQTLLVHLSTLAVAGCWQGGSNTFSEADFDRSDQFLSPYERSKARAERLVRDYGGCRVQVIRTGHVAAHSGSGRFQRNIDANRICQILRSYIELGVAPKWPSEPLAFSQVDVVARGVVALSLNTDQRGVFHVETPHQVSNAWLCAALSRFGWPVQPVPMQDYRARLSDATGVGGVHRSVVAANVWASLPPRGFVFDCSRTHALLRHLGVVFPAPSEAWLYRFLLHAIAGGFLPPPLEQRVLA